MAHINIHKFPGGEIHVGVVHDEKGMVLHAYRFYRAHLKDEQWWGTKKGLSAEAAIKLAYGKEKVMGREKTAPEVWDSMMPYLEPIPKSTGI